jgi:hypothetical protein
VKPSRDTEKEAAGQAAACGHVEILKYFVDTRKISDEVKSDCVVAAAKFGRLDCLKYLVEEAKVPLNDWQDIAFARYHEQPDCVNYLLKKGCPEPTDEEYAKSSTEKNYHTNTYTFLILMNKRERLTTARKKGVFYLTL